jgi:drug/metabolite transporter (DMT)-like permease
MSEVLVAVTAGLGAAFLIAVSDSFLNLGLKKVNEISANLVFIFTSFLGAFLFIPFDPQLPLEFGINTLLILVGFAIAETAVFISLLKAYKKGQVTILDPITSAYVVFSVLVSVIIFQEQISPLVVPLIILTILGIFLVSTKFSELKKGLTKNNVAAGTGLALLFAVLNGSTLPFWDAYFSRSGWPILIVIEKLFLLIFVYLFFTITNSSKLKIKFNKYYLYVGAAGFFQALISAIFTIGFIYSSKTSIQNTLAATYPLFMSLIGYFILKEKLELNQYLGIILIVASVIGILLI